MNEAPGEGHPVEVVPAARVEVEERRERNGGRQGVGDGEGDEQGVGRRTSHRAPEQDDADEAVGDESERGEQRHQNSVHG